jgi:hypothetical protein
MGTLKSGVKYIYEKVNGVTYAREFGADPSTRHEVGYDYDPRTPDGRPLHDHLMEDKMWGEIRRMANTDEGMKDLLDRVVVYYNLKKEQEDIPWHPV